MSSLILDTRDMVRERKAFLFDFDGTLVNLDKLNLDSFKIVLEEKFDLSFTKDDFMKYISGRGSKDGIAMYLDSLSIKEYDVDSLAKEFNRVKRDLVDNHLDEEVFLIPGIEEFLKFLKRKSKRMVVVTSSHYDYVRDILTYFGLFDYFEKVYDRGSVKKSKPDPETFLQGIKYTKLDVDDCIAFEDSLFGLMSAKDANLFTVGILNEGWNEEFVYELADIVIESYEELI